MNIASKMKIQNLPYLLSIWSVGMGVMGIVHNFNVEPVRAASLIFVLLVFSLLLTQLVGMFLRERTRNVPKTCFLVFFMIGLSVLEASLLHYGLMWVVEGTGVAESLIWAASGFFVFVALFAKWACTPSPEIQKEPVTEDQVTTPATLSGVASILGDIVPERAA